MPPDPLLPDRDGGNKKRRRGIGVRRRRRRSKLDNASSTVVVALAAAAFVAFLQVTSSTTTQQWSWDLGNTQTSTEKQEPECPVAFVPIGGRCYFYGGFRLNWFRAMEFCHSFGGDVSLAAIETSEENSAIREWLLQNGDHSTGVWVGGSDNGHPGKWAWFPTGQLIRDFNWGPAQPSGKGQHCMYIVGGFLGYQWADFHCDFQMTFLCEENVNPGVAWRKKRRKKRKKMISHNNLGVGPNVISHKDDFEIESSGEAEVMETNHRWPMEDNEISQVTLANRIDITEANLPQDEIRNVNFINDIYETENGDSSGEDKSWSIWSVVGMVKKVLQGNNII